jgi:glycosyltransferase involved in cell wall biosynthesis
MPTVSVIVPARDAAATIGRTLDALARQQLEESFEVIVVDDGSTDATAAIASSSSLAPIVVPTPGAGPGPARNAGAERARSELLAFTDADCRPRSDWLRRGIAALGDADLVQGTVVPDPEAVRGPYDRTISVHRPHGLYETANMFVRRDLLERLGGFEDPLGARLGKPLGEDVWFGWRAQRSGARVAFSDAAVVEHEVFPRSRRAFVGERLRLVYFPALVARIPELRESLLWNRWFLSRRSAAFAAGAAGTAIAIAAALLSGSPWVALACLATWAPYAAIAGREALGWRRRAPDALATGIAADLVGFGALVAGAARSRAPVL